jgi:all-trans-retinol 13,14-reductase
MDRYDAIIIGSGLGGLVSAASLAKKGKKVLVIEQHDKFGGCATNFKRKGFELDSGLHLIDGLGPKDKKTHIFKELGIYDRLEFIDSPEFYHFSNAGDNITIPFNTDEITAVLEEKYPHESKGIRKFFKVFGAIRSEVDFISTLGPIKRALYMLISPIRFPHTVKNLKTNLGDYMDSIIADENVKMALLGNIGFYHDDPYTMSLIYFATANGSFYREGGHYIKGGSQKLSDALEDVIRQAGGELISRHSVTAILQDKGKATGVEYCHVSRPETVLSANSKIVISNANIPDVANKLLGGLASEKLKKRIAGLEPSPSISCLFLMFNTQVSNIIGPHFSSFVVDEKAVSIRDFGRLMKSDFKERGYLLTNYGALDTNMGKPGKSCATLCFLDNYDYWDKLDKEQYTAKKAEVSSVFLERLEKRCPGIMQKIEHHELSTPKTIERYIKTPKGAIYGFAQTPSQAIMNRIKYKSPLKGLFFSSAWNFPGGGFSGAINSGWNCSLVAMKSGLL